MPIRFRVSGGFFSLSGGVAALAVAAGAVMLCGSAAHAQLTLTPAANMDGRHFILTTFATDFPSNSNIGPTGVDFPIGGGVLVSSFNGNLQFFPNAHVDDQSALAFPPFHVFPGFNNALGLAHLGSTVYMTQFTNGRVVQLNPDGSINHNLLDGVSQPRGIVADPAHDRLFVALGGGIIDLNPVSGAFTTLANVTADGLSLSPDGSIVYGAVFGTGHILGFNTVSGVQVFDSGFITGGGDNIDGTALGYGPLTGKIYVNTTGVGGIGGRVIEVELSTHIQTIIANMGSRGDFVAPDPSNNGDLLLTQTDRIMRLRGIPEPGTASLVALGGALLLRRRRTGV